MKISKLAREVVASSELPESFNTHKLDYAWEVNRQGQIICLYTMRDAPNFFFCEPNNVDFIDKHMYRLSFFDSRKSILIKMNRQNPEANPGMPDNIVVDSIQVDTPNGIDSQVKQTIIDFLNNVTRLIDAEQI